MLVGELAIDDEDFLAADMGVALKAGSRPPAHERHAFPVVLMQRQDRDPLDEAGRESRCPRIDDQ